MDVVWGALSVICWYGYDAATKMLHHKVTTPAGLKETIFNLYWCKQERKEALIILKHLKYMWVPTSFKYSVEVWGL